nr:TetR/AcrR family transcriptional regulator [uncultured Holophaga sp.]
MPTRSATSSPDTPDPSVQDRLLQAGLQCLATLGGHKASVKQIATLAGVNHGLVHYYFGSKEALMVALFRRMAEGQLRALSRIRDPRGLKRMLSHFALPNTRLILEFALLAREMPELRQALQVQLRKLARLSADRMAHGDLRDGWLLVSTVAGLALHFPEMDEIDMDYMAQRIMTWMRPELA